MYFRPWNFSLLFTLNHDIQSTIEHISQLYCSSPDANGHVVSVCQCASSLSAICWSVISHSASGFFVHSNQLIKNWSKVIINHIFCFFYSLFPGNHFWCWLYPMMWITMTCYCEDVCQDTAQNRNISRHYPHIKWTEEREIFPPISSADQDYYQDCLLYNL